MAGGAVVAGGGGGNPFKTGFITRPYLPAFILVTSLFFLWGFAYGLLDVLNKKFQTVLGVTKLESTGLQVMYFGVGYLLYSPVAGEILKRKGYKITILSGLFLYSLGAILFWPVAKFSIGTTNPNAIFGGFLICTGVIACGLATLEVSANSYVSVLPPINVANFRLQFSQSFNGVASFTGPLIASKYFFAEENAKDLTNVQWVYLAVSGMGAIIAAAFVFTKIPEVSEQELEERAEAAAHAQGREMGDIGPFWKQTRAITGFVAQFLYVGAQVTIGTFFLNYTHDAAGINDQQGAQLLSYALICFTVARFICTALLSVIAAPVLLAFCAAMATLMIVLIGSLHGMGGVVCLILIMGFESLMYPVIFVLGTANLGRHTRRAAGLLVMGVAGGAAFPPMQGAIAVAYNTRVSFFICVPCFLYITLWAVWIWNKDGRHFLVRTEQAALAQLTISQGEVAPAHVGLNHKGEAIGNFEPIDKDEVERVEKA